MHVRQAYMILGAAAVVLCVIAYLILAHSSLPIQLAQTPQEHRDLPPPMTPLMQEQLAKSSGFQHLVSYGDDGFSPAALTVAAGDTVRFTNNSTKDVWIASVNYPGQSSCGGSSFDTCLVLKSGEFWEFTFDEVGSWTYKNNADTQYKASITVDVQ